VEMMPLPMFARERGLSTREAMTMLRAIPGALVQPRKGCKHWVNMAALQAMKTIAGRVDELEESRQDHEIRISSLEGKAA